MYTRDATLITREINTDYIRGFADADGGFTCHYVGLHNTDLVLLEIIRERIEALGIKAVLTIQKPDRYKPIGHLQISGLSNLVKYAMLIGFSMERKQKALEEYIKFVTREGRPYNPDDYDKYLEMSSKNMSYRKMAKKLGLSPSAIDRREKRGTYPLDDMVLRGVRQIRNE